jgi:hypothetical protein
MKLIRVRAAETTARDRVVFDQLVGRPLDGEPSRVIIRADGKAHLVNGALTVVKEAIKRGELVALDETDEAPDAERPKLTAAGS